ncbi:VrrA/YqfQ family protein [Lysinibacillus sp. 54212]|uniref:VrrA/YqfQ family protein n=1 Tax=Lysinibacillus sp. 54212 TaxID=3119829 RepID=UPI002FC58ACB
MYPGSFYRQFPYAGMPMPMRMPTGAPMGIPMRMPISPIQPFQQMSQLQSFQQMAPQASRLDQFLQTTDKLMKTAEQYGPYVQQAVPLMRNLPALYNLYKGFKGLPNEENIDQAAAASPQPSPSPAPNRREQVQAYEQRPSLPRIYQP